MISWRKPCGKTTTKMGRKHYEGILVAAECKRTETSKRQEFLEGGCTRGHGPKRSVAPFNNNNNRNVVQKEAEKKLKYKSLCIEIQRMWNMKCTIVPVIIGATGIVTRSLRKYLETVPGKYSIYSLQKTAILGTSHIIRKILQCEA